MHLLRSDGFTGHLPTAWNLRLDGYWYLLCSGCAMLCGDAVGIGYKDQRGGGKITSTIRPFRAYSDHPPPSHTRFSLPTFSAAFFISFLSALAPDPSSLTPSRPKNRGKIHNHIRSRRIWTYRPKTIHPTHVASFLRRSELLSSIKRQRWSRGWGNS